MKRLLMWGLVAIGLCSFTVPSYAAKIIKGSPDFCRLQCTSDKCKTEKGFQECLRRCKDNHTPLLRKCVLTGMKAGFKIPEPLKKHYKQYLKRPKQSGANPMMVASSVNLKNLVDRCHVARERVEFYRHRILGTPFEGILVDIIYRIDNLIGQLMETTIVDAFAIDNAAECRSLGTAVEDLFGKLVNSAYFQQFKTVPLPSKGPYAPVRSQHPIPGMPYQGKSMPRRPGAPKRYIIREDVLAKQKTELRKEIEEDMLKKQMGGGEDVEDQHPEASTAAGRPQHSGGKSHKSGVQLFEE